MPGLARQAAGLPGRAVRSLLRRIAKSPGLLRSVRSVFGVKGLARLISWTVDPNRYVAGQATCLCIERSIFDRDLDQMRLRCPDVNWIGVRDYVLGNVQALWTPHEMQEQTAYVMAKGPEADRAWQISEEFARSFLEQCAARFNIQAILSANIDYWHDEGLRRAARGMKIPFLALSKEHVTFPASHRLDFVERYGKTYSFKFTGDAVAVYGEATERALVDCGACTAEQITITGSPRFDALGELRWDERNANMVTLMSYSTPDYFAEQNFAEVLNVFEEAAAAAPAGIEFIVKCKSTEDEDQVRRLARGGRVRITRRIDVDEVLQRSRAVIGFNSLTVIEACYTGATIIVPFWGQTKLPVDALNVHPDRSVCGRVIRYPENPEALRALLMEAARLDPQPLSETGRADRLAIVREFFYIPATGSCSQQVADFVRRRISRSA